MGLQPPSQKVMENTIKMPCRALCKIALWLQRRKGERLRIETGGTPTGLVTSLCLPMRGLCHPAPHHPHALASTCVLVCVVDLVHCAPEYLVRLLAS